jgi:hypothetical protein
MEKSITLLVATPIVLAVASVILVSMGVVWILAVIEAGTIHLPKTTSF